MLVTYAKLVAVVLGTVGLYTVIANAIPQLESEVPQELVLTGAFSADELVAAGEQLYDGAGGCTVCHGLGTRAPNLLTDEGGTGLIGARCATRVPGQSCKEYLYESLVAPNDHVIEGYEPIMPDMSRTLSPTQIWALVAFLQSQGGTVDVTQVDIGEAAEATGSAASPAAATAAASPVTATEPMDILRGFQCTVCHQIAGEGGALGPPLDDIGSRMDAAALRHSILFPNADTAAGYEALAGTMPPNFGEQMSAAQLEALVEYLAGRQ
ncbi:MAG: c-type cytochrome [Longimicrobiales bacterium]